MLCFSTLIKKARLLVLIEKALQTGQRIFWQTAYQMYKMDISMCRAKQIKKIGNSKCHGQKEMDYKSDGSASARSCFNSKPRAPL